MDDNQRRRFLANRAAKLARQRRRRKRVSRNAWRHLTRDQQEVAKRLTKGQISLVTISGWGFLASFLAFLDELEFYALLGMEGTGFKRVMIPIARLIMTYQLKILLGIPSINLVPTKLFREIALLKLIGYTTTQMQVGFCERGNLAQGPMHKNTLADAVERLSAEELERLFNETACRLAERGFFQKSKGHFALDATDLETTARCKDAGMKKYTERKVTTDKQVVEVERYAYGFKVLIVYEVRLRLVVAAKVVPIQKHESQFTLTLVRQAVKNVGPGVVRVLLIDRGFLDGQDLWVLKQGMGIDFVVPAKEDMRVTADAQGLSRAEADGEHIIPHEHAGTRRVVKKGKKTEVRWEGQVSLVGIAELRSYDQYGDAEHSKHANRKGFTGNALNAVVVTKWAGEAYAVGKEKVFLTSLPITKPLEVLDLYDLRSLIENTVFRELKQGWHLNKYPKKTEAAIRGHVFLTLVTFTLANAFRTALGQELAGRGVRRQRAEEESNKVIVFADDFYAIFDIEEVFILLGVVPQQCLRAEPAKVRRRYGLISAA
ncbi:MAG: hypothetical protein EPO21_24465 [Chloroflexota bacterium]|nr:MAG: hypothetical protein EPO21_24465 [Chloroflexota bacterium]